MKEAKAIGAPSRVVRESRQPKRFGSYIALVIDIIETEPFGYEEAASQQVWREAMVEEYASIIKNDVWEIVPRPEGK